MIKYSLSHDITLELPVDEPDVSAIYKLSTPSPRSELYFSRIIRDLMMGWGFHGQHVGETSTTAMCLEASMNSPVMEKWSPKLVEGADVLARFKVTPYPPGVCS